MVQQRRSVRDRGNVNLDLLFGCQWAIVTNANGIRCNLIMNRVSTTATAACFLNVPDSAFQRQPRSIHDWLNDTKCTANLWNANGRLISFDLTCNFFHVILITRRFHRHSNVFGRYYNLGMRSATSEVEVLLEIPFARFIFTCMYSILKQLIGDKKVGMGEIHEIPRIAINSNDS